MHRFMKLVVTTICLLCSILSANALQPHFRFKDESVGLNNGSPYGTQTRVPYAGVRSLPKEQLSGNDNSSIAALKVLIPNNHIDFGKVLLGSFKDSLQIPCIQNTGDKPIDISAIYFVGSSNDPFQLLSSSNPYILQPNEIYKVDVRYTPWLIDGVKTTATLEVQYAKSTQVLRLRFTGEGYLPDTIPGIVKVTNSIDFGDVPLGQFKEMLQIPCIKNIGDTAVEVQSISLVRNGSTDFILLTNSAQTILKPNDVLNVSLRFTPLETGASSSVTFVVFGFKGVRQSVKIPLIGSGITLDMISTDVSVANIQTRVGDSIKLAIVIKGRNLSNAPKQYKAKLLFNNTIIHITDPAYTCTPLDNYYCELEITGTRLEGDTIVSIPAISTLGTTDFSEIQLTSFEWLDMIPGMEMGTSNGTIRLTDICESGGVRLYIPSGANSSLVARPSPASDKVDIIYGLNENTQVSIEIINMSGQVVMTPVANLNQSIGEYRLSVNISTLGAGVYSIRYTTPNSMLTTRLDIVR